MLILSSDSDSHVEPSLPKPRFASRSRMGVIQDRGHLLVGIVTDMPGFAERDEATGRLRGLDVEVAKFLGRSIFGGSRRSAAEHIDFVEIHLNDREHVLESGTVDLVIAAYAITPERAKKVDFSAPYFGTSLGVLLNNDCTPDFERLAGSRLAVPTGTVGARFAFESELSQHIVEYETVGEMVEAVATGDVSACVTTSPVLDNFARANPVRLIRPTWSLLHLPHGVGFKQNDYELREFVDAQLNRIWSDGALFGALSQMAAPAPART